MGLSRSTYDAASFAGFDSARTDPATMMAKSAAGLKTAGIAAVWCGPRHREQQSSMQESRRLMQKRSTSTQRRKQFDDHDQLTATTTRSSSSTRLTGSADEGLKPGLVAITFHHDRRRHRPYGCHPLTPLLVAGAVSYPDQPLNRYAGRCYAEDNLSESTSPKVSLLPLGPRCQ